MELLRPIFEAQILPTDPKPRSSPNSFAKYTRFKRGGLFASSEARKEVLLLLQKLQYKRIQLEDVTG